MKEMEGEWGKRKEENGKNMLPPVALFWFKKIEEWLENEMKTFEMKERMDTSVNGQWANSIMGVVDY